MSIVEEMGNALAREVIEALDEIGDERFFDKVGKVLGDASPTLQEAFMTAIRVRLADVRARKFLAQVLKAKRDGSATPRGGDSGL